LINNSFIDFYTFNIHNNIKENKLLCSNKINTKQTSLEEIRKFINTDPQYPILYKTTPESHKNRKRLELSSFIFYSNKSETKHYNNILSKNKLKSKDLAKNNSYNFNSNFSLRDINQDLNYNNITSNSAIYNTNDFNTEKIQNFLTNLLTRKKFVFIYFEIINFNFCLKDYFKSIYPEINLVMIFNINDCVLSQEKIFFINADENIYYPILKKEDMNFQDYNKINRYRIIKPVDITDYNYPIKISFLFYTFTNQKLLSIGSENLFFKIGQENNMKKFYKYQNIHLKYVSKKVGNLSFNYCYKLDELYSHDMSIKKKKNLKEFAVRNYLNIFLLI